MSTPVNPSEVARLRAQIDAEYRAAYNGLHGLIPFRNLTSNIEMRKIRQGTETLRIISKSRKSLTEHLCDTFERGKTAVVKVFFTQFVPDMLDGIEFGAVGRLGNY
jgi:hypothetical protein